MISFDAAIHPLLVLMLVGVAGSLAGLRMRTELGTRFSLREPIVLLRLLGLVAIALTMLNPVLTRTLANATANRVVVIVDNSRSMGIRDETNNLSRAERVDALLQTNLPAWLRTDALEWQVVGLDGASPYTVGQEPSGDQSDVAAGLAAALDSPDNDRLVGIVLLSDGRWNSGDDPELAARKIAMRKIPLYTVPFGSARIIPDLWVKELTIPEFAYPGETLETRVDVRSRLAESQALTVTLARDGVTVANRVVTVPAGVRTTPVAFMLPAGKPGEYAYTASVEGVVDEEIVDNNHMTRSVTIQPDTVHVLYIEEMPRWEYRFVRNVLRRDPGAELTTFLKRPGIGPAAGAGYITTIPTEVGELGKYDVIIIGDIDPAILGAKRIASISELCRNKGVGLIFSVGERHGVSKWRGTELEDLLPVSLKTLAPRLSRSQERISLYVPPEGLDHVLLSLRGNKRENAEHLGAHLAFNWTAACGPLKPSAQAIAYHRYRIVKGQRMPVIAAWRQGRGKILYLGTDELWRLREWYADRYHYRFWAQAIRWAKVRKGFSESDRYTFFLASNQGKVGEAVGIEAFVLGWDSYPTEDAVVTVAGADGAVHSLQPEAGNPGMYRGNVVIRAEGENVFRPVVRIRDASEPGPALTLMGIPSAIEYGNVTPNHVLLRQLAAMTGGAMLPPEQADKLDETIHKTITERYTLREHHLARNWIWAIIAVAIFCSEWLLRKFRGFI